MKKCPFCAEDVQDEAILCKHCHTDISHCQQPVINTETDTVSVCPTTKTRKFLMTMPIVILALLAMLLYVNVRQQKKAIIEIINEYYGYDEKTYKYDIPLSVVMPRNKVYGIYITFDDNSGYDNINNLYYNTSWFVDVAKNKTGYRIVNSDLDRRELKCVMRLMRRALTIRSEIDFEFERAICHGSNEEMIEINMAQGSPLMNVGFLKGYDLEKGRRTFNIKYPKIKL